MRVECSCGLSIDCTLPFYCRCGRVYEPDGIVAATCCRFRGDRKGWASCKCGIVYECPRLGKYCTERTPVDDLVEIHFDDGRPVSLVMHANFQACGTCDDYQTGPVEPVP